MNVSVEYHSRRNDGFVPIKPVLSVRFAAGIFGADAVNRWFTE